MMPCLHRALAGGWLTRAACCLLTPVQLCPRAGWAFSAAAALESAYLINGGKSLDLSEQQLVDCLQNFCPDPVGVVRDCCRYPIQPDMKPAWEFIKVLGVTSEGNYPYLGRAFGCNVIKLLNTPDNAFVHVNAAPTLLPPKSATELLKVPGWRCWLPTGASIGTACP